MTNDINLFDLSPGKVLDGRFEIGQAQRQGGMFAAFEVIDRQDGELRELQVFPRALFDSPAQAAEFAAELDRWRKVDSPHVLHVQESRATERGNVLLVTDPPPGVSLRRWLAEHERAGIERALGFGAQMLQGLEAIHARGLVHGDVKPFTLHVDFDVEQPGGARLVLVDGGITIGLWTAKHLGDKTALVGTPIYAPIEQFGGDPPNEQSDVYNAATVLFELLTGVVPWPGSNFLEIFQAKLAPKVPLMRERAPGVDVPPQVESVVADGLRTDARLRWPSARSFRDALRAATAAK